MYISIISIVVGIGLASFTNCYKNHQLSFVYPWTYIADGQRLSDNYRRMGETKYKRYYFCGEKKLSLYETKYVSVLKPLFVYQPHLTILICFYIIIITTDFLHVKVYKMYNILSFNWFTRPSIILIMQVKSI